MNQVDNSPVSATNVNSESFIDIFTIPVWVTLDQSQVNFLDLPLLKLSI